MLTKSAQEQVEELQTRLDIYEAYFDAKDGRTENVYEKGSPQYEAFEKGKEEYDMLQTQLEISNICKTLVTAFHDLFAITSK